jgi:hypothetical protein
MNPVITSLLALVESDGLPAAHTSSHWQRYGREIVAQRRGKALMLRAAGFTAQSRASLAGRFLYGAERLSYANVTSRLHSYPLVWSETKRLARDLGTDLTGHERTSATAFAVLADHFRHCRLAPKTMAVIGDGDGFLGALIFRCLAGTGVKMYAIDLPKVLLFQAETHRTANPGVTMSVLLAGDDGRKADLTFVHPKDIERIPDAIDCAINVVSMQEMTVSSIAAYFVFLRRRSTARSRFYCVNRWRKELPGGEVASFADYPWQANDETFIDGPCPYLKYFFDQQRQPDGPRVLGLRIPFVNAYDGLLWHRLVRLAPLT